VIGNVGDDIDGHGLHISPDLDIVVYTLAGLVDPAKGWGFGGDSFYCQEMLGHLGYETWFNLGDRDLATHIYRTEQLRAGKRLSEVTQSLVRDFGLRIKLLPATDNTLQTYVLTKNGYMHFEEYMVKRQTAPKVLGVRFRGAASAKSARNVIESIEKADCVIIAPSNPIVSIGAILAVPGIRSALQRTKARKVGISPIIGGKTVKGPADKLMRAVGFRATALGVAECYRNFLDTLIIDRVDRKLAPEIQDLGIRTIVTNTLMKRMSDKVRLAKIAVSETKR
jgi:LPPG:FO 2-phospho-L-lactate transferase